MWNPWRHLRDWHPRVTVHTHHQLPGHTLGIQQGDIVWLDRNLTQTERRCTLAHEILHLERGSTLEAPWWKVREEAAVDRAAARRLINLDELVDALLWTRQRDELAAELWIDVNTLTALASSLTPSEQAWINEQLNQRQP